jgi:hypothetical protein
MTAPNARRCIVCDRDITRDASRCTNRCCGECHARHCTPGGITSPGHGLDVKRARAEHAAKAAADDRSSAAARKC